MADENLAVYEAAMRAKAQKAAGNAAERNPNIRCPGIAEQAGLLNLLAKNPGNVLSMDLELTGSIQINGGIETIAKRNGLAVETEPVEEDPGLCFLVARLGNVEIIQISDSAAE